MHAHHASVVQPVNTTQLQTAKKELKIGLERMRIMLVACTMLKQSTPDRFKF